MFIVQFVGGIKDKQVITLPELSLYFETLRLPLHLHPIDLNEESSPPTYNFERILYRLFKWKTSSFTTIWKYLLT